MAETTADRSFWSLITALMLAETAVKVPSPVVVWVFRVKVMVPAAERADRVALLEPEAVTPTPAPAVLMDPAMTLAPALAA